MGKKCKLVALMVVICMVTTLLPVVPVEDYEASEKVSSELLELLDVTYEDLSAGNYVDSGERYSCIIWIQDVEVEEAVEAGIDAAEKTREDYSVWSRYDYPYTSYEADGLTYVEVEFDENETDEYVQTYIEAEREAAVELYSANNSSFVAENFMARDMSVTYVSKYSPCVFAELSVTKVGELLREDMVSYIGIVTNSYIDNSSYDIVLSTEEIQENADIIRADAAKEYFAVSGEGVKIGQIEGYYPDKVGVIRNEGEDIEDILEPWHANNVHSIMSEVAPDATYYATGTIVSHGDFYEQVEWLLDQGVNVINMSSTLAGNTDTYTEEARWVDHIAYNHDVHFVFAAGNSAETGVFSPGMAYNAVTVGAVYDSFPHNIIYQGEYQGSSYTSLSKVSRLSQIPHKPDVMAPGSFSNDWGTSYSAPYVTGTIALMCEYMPALKVQQHIVKAILAATAGKITHSHNYTIQESQFEKYGAGIIDARSALYQIYMRTYSTSTGTLSTVGASKTYSMTVTSNDTCMRIAVAHANRIKFAENQDHTTGVIPASNYPGVVAIKVYNPDGELILDSYDIDLVYRTNLQVVEFDPRVNGGVGTYTIEVVLKEMASGGRATNFGIAWR